MRAVLIIAAKEVRDALRNRWVVAMTILLAALALTLAFLGSAPTGAVKVSPLTVTVVSLSSLTIFLLPLIALLLSYDAIIGEIDRGTMALLLAYPVSRPAALFGKFLGHLAVLALATVLGYGAAALAIVVAHGRAEPEALSAFVAMIGSSVLLGAAFLALGYLLSTAVRDRGTAAGAAVGVWLLFVLIYDMGLLGVLVADRGQFLTVETLKWLLLLNPADAFRLLNFTGFENVSMLSGMGGIGEQARLGQPVLLGALALWAVLPLGAAAALFGRREL
jgi:Cu-processing system permease protein